MNAKQVAVKLAIEVAIVAGTAAIGYLASRLSRAHDVLDADYQPRP